MFSDRTQMIDLLGRDFTFQADDAARERGDIKSGRSAVQFGCWNLVSYVFF